MPAISAPAATTSTVPDPAAAQTRVPTKTLGQDDFLKLLSVQMTSQDPMNPQKDTDFIAQMAQFNSLETMQGVQSGITQLRQDQQTLQATTMLGQTVKVQVDSTNTTTGVVSSVRMSSGTPQLVVNNQPYSLSQIISISPTNLY